MELPIILSAITTFAIICSVIFAGLQIRVMQKQRSREAELLLAHSFQTPEFMKAYGLVMTLPDGLSKNEIVNHLGEKNDLILLWLGTWESLGILVFRKEISLSVVDDFFSGPIIISWRKLSNYVMDYRNEQQRETFHEWFQWLAERMMERESKTPAKPAHLTNRNWRE